MLSGMTKVIRRGIIYPRSLGCLPRVGALELRCVLGLQVGLLLLHTREATVPLQSVGYLLCTQAFLYTASLPVPESTILGISCLSKKETEFGGD